MYERLDPALLLMATARVDAAAAAMSSSSSPGASMATWIKGARAPNAWRSSALSTGRTSSFSSSSASKRSSLGKDVLVYMPVASLMYCASVGCWESASSTSRTSFRFCSSSSIVHRDWFGTALDAAVGSGRPWTSTRSPALTLFAISRSFVGSEFLIAQLNSDCIVSWGMEFRSRSSDPGWASPRGS